MRSFVENKSNQCWLWLAIDYETHATIIFVFGRCKYKVFEKLQIFLKPFGIHTYYTDVLGIYFRKITVEKHQTGKTNIQRIERKNLTL